METTNQKITTENKKLMMGALALVIAGLAFIFLIPLGSLTDNRFGTHLVLSSDLSTAGEQGWFTVLTMVTGLAFVGAGIKLAVFNNLNIININENQDRTFKMGATLLVGSAAFILALSSISFAAFNSQYFESQIKNGTSDQAWAWIALTWISVAAVIIFIALGYFGIIRLEKNNVYLTLRNSSVALVALGWFVFNLCINSFGAMGGDAAVLAENLWGISLTQLGVNVSQIESIDSLAQLGEYTGLDIYHLVTGETGEPGKVDIVWNNVIKLWDEGKGPAIAILDGIVPGFGTLIQNEGGLANLFTDLAFTLPDTLGVYLQTFSKSGPIMGVNNSMNSLLIFISLLGTGVIGIPLYGVLVGSNYDENKTSVMYVGSIVLIVVMSLIYLFLALTPYMAETIPYNYDKPLMEVINSLLLGKYGGFCPGLIAQAGNPGGIHSALVYFSPQYDGTITWWIAEVLTFVSLVASFVGSWLVIKTLNNKSETKE